MNNIDLDEQERKIIENFKIARTATVAILIIGVVFYHFVEKLSWINSFYFCVVTLTTVGYGDITPTTEFGRLFTAFYILTGVGILAVFLNLVIKKAVINRRSGR